MKLDLDDDTFVLSLMVASIFVGMVIMSFMM